MSSPLPPAVGRAISSTSLLVGSGRQPALAITFGEPPLIPDRRIAGVADLLLFHHALGLTTGCVSFADRLRADGHVVHVPDLYEGRTFTDLAVGVTYAEEIGFDTIVERGRGAAEALP